MYGLLIEQKYMQNYPGNLLDFCGYRAIEQFEETIGDPNGLSMGENYFERKNESYEIMINKNIENTITNQVFQKFPPKLKMQIWSFMFNSTDASTGTIKWIAGLGQAMGLNQNSDAKNEQEYRIRVMDKSSKEYADVINSIKNFKGSWDNVYDNYLKVLDQQYMSTANNNNKKGSYENSWKYRPTKLNQFYDQCSGGSQQQGQQPTPTTPQQPTTKKQPQTNKPKTIEVTGINSFHDELTGKTSGGISIDVSSVVFSRTNSTFKVSYSTGETKIAGMTLVFSEINREELDVRIETKMKKGLYPNLIQKDEWKGNVGKYYYEFLILIK
jgi:hypothetical protein